ncbi:MAG: YbaN family protein [Cohaesibacter sp.]|nr:YbaN family protein [Cohaesibacter sp.]MCV6602572.1 YbaN family protein [Cohaesibacter sp.]
MKQLERGLYLTLGLVMSGVGIIGAFLPVMPSTIFFMAAAFCFARSSPRLEAWILNHPLFGPPVVAWRDHQAIPRKAKYTAFGGMAFGFMSFLYFAKPDWYLLLPVMAFFLYSAWYVGSRPEGPTDQ